MKQIYLAICAAMTISSAQSQTFTLFKDINPGSAHSNATAFSVIDGTLYFSAENGTNGLELWKSDGTSGGTVMIKDIRHGAGSSKPEWFIKLGNSIFFSANDGVHGEELWKTDGTSAGTVLVKDIRYGHRGSAIENIVRLGNNLIFVADDGWHGREIWKTDGTAAGTDMIKDINLFPDIPGFGGIYPGNNANPRQLTIMNGYVYFAATNGYNPFGDTPGQGLWRTDGTEAGTTLIKYTTIEQIRNINNKLFFTGTDNPAVALWTSDGTTAGTTMLKYVGSNQGGFTEVNGYACILTTGISGNIELWKSDGTVAGTVIVRSIPKVGTTYIYGNLTAAGGLAYFTAAELQAGTEVWKSDLTTPGTHVVKDINPGTANSDPNSFYAYSNTLYFCADDGSNGRELWKSNGAFFNTVFVQDTENGGDGSPAILFQLGSKLFAAVTTLQFGRELWIADAPAPSLPSPLPVTTINNSDPVVTDISNDQPVVTLYPNPAKNAATVMISIKRKERITLTIVDMNGKTLQTKRVYVNEGSNQVPLETGSLSSGMYNVIITGEKTKTITRLLKQ